MNLIEIQNRIVSEKIKLRKKSKNFVNNFKKIEKYIQKEVAIIKESKVSIIPEIEFDDIHAKYTSLRTVKVNIPILVTINTFSKDYASHIKNNIQYEEVNFLLLFEE